MHAASEKRGRTLCDRGARRPFVRVGGSIYLALGISRTISAMIPGGVAVAPLLGVLVQDGVAQMVTPFAGDL
jgi:hypothetical protein